jgi:hypothetical protein
MKRTSLNLKSNKLIFLAKSNQTIILYMYPHGPVIPPLAETCCPVIHLACSDTNNSVASAISAVVPILSAALVRPNNGRVASARAVGSLGRISVPTGPGATEFTVIPRLLPNCLRISFDRCNEASQVIPRRPKHMSMSLQLLSLHRRLA